MVPFRGIHSQPARPGFRTPVLCFGDVGLGTRRPELFAREPRRKRLANRVALQKSTV